jgi:hypothetical protein
MDETILVLLVCCAVVFATMIGLCVAGFIQEVFKSRR